MSLVPMKVEITKEEYDKLSTLSSNDLREEICKIAISLDYHPFGYGCYNEQIYTDGEKYFVAWERWNSCD